MHQLDPKTHLLEHSEAKVQLYGRYLSVFLNILHNADFIKRVFLFDLFCGEGIYENEVAGSPIIALQAIKNHYFANNKSCPNMTVWFNDNGLSEIENGIYKVERVERVKNTIYTPTNVEIEFYKEDFEDIYPRAVNLAKANKDARALFFIDPFGYKSIRPSDIHRILESLNSEVLLWLPIAQMYRFADSVAQSEYPGSQHLKEFLTALFGNNLPVFRSSPFVFIDKLKEKFREYLKDLNVFVDTFYLERDTSNVYCLFFFTRNIRGFGKMVETKWKMDVNRGKGHTIEKTLSFLSELELSGYKQKLKDFISKDYRTNMEIYQFGLENGFLPKHSKTVLDEMKESLVLLSLDAGPVGGYHIGNKERRIKVRVKS